MQLLKYIAFFILIHHAGAACQYGKTPAVQLLCTQWNATEFMGKPPIFARMSAPTEEITEITPELDAYFTRQARKANRKSFWKPLYHFTMGSALVALASGGVYYAMRAQKHADRQDALQREYNALPIGTPQAEFESIKSRFRAEGELAQKEGKQSMYYSLGALGVGVVWGVTLVF
jgi:hypothetical protein